MYMLNIYACQARAAFGPATFPLRWGPGIARVQRIPLLDRSIQAAAEIPGGYRSIGPAPKNGVQGSRVQIPPSRLVKRSRCKDSRVRRKQKVNAPRPLCREHHLITFGTSSGDAPSEHSPARIYARRNIALKSYMAILHCLANEIYLELLG